MPHTQQIISAETNPGFWNAELASALNSFHLHILKENGIVRYSHKKIRIRIEGQLSWQYLVDLESNLELSCFEVDLMFIDNFWLQIHRRYEYAFKNAFQDADRMFQRWQLEWMEIKELKSNTINNKMSSQNWTCV